MAQVSGHYETLLAEHYSWAFGGHAKRVAQEEAWFRAHGFVGPGRALDLGAGSGFQAIALARLGYRVTAVDSSPTLIAELREQGKDLNLEVVQGDLLELSPYVAHPPRLVVCKGDTLPHLPSRQAVRALFGSVHALLEPGGSFVLSFRDLSVELRGVDRIIPVRADGDRSFLCFLEYLPDRVHVHDVVQLRTEAGWLTKKSWYAKLRLAALEVEAWLREAGFAEVWLGESAGMVELTAQKA